MDTKSVSSKKGKKTETWPEIPGSPAFKEAALRFKESRAATKHPMTPLAMVGLIKHLDKFTESEIIEAIDAAIIGGYQGVFPKKSNGNGNLFGGSQRTPSLVGTNLSPAGPRHWWDTTAPPEMARIGEMMSKHEPVTDDEASSLIKWQRGI